MYKCNKCQQLKPETEFYRNNKHYRSGYSYNCIPCTKQYYLESKEKTKVRVKADKQNDPIKYMLYNIFKNLIGLFYKKACIKHTGQNSGYIFLSITKKS
jgi:hypothetical protein